MKRIPRALLWLTALALVAVACSTDATESTEATSGAATDATTAATDAAPVATDAPDATEATEAMAELLTDVGVTDDTIKVGLLSDLSGIFAPLVANITDAQIAYWDAVNAAGGIAGGRMVELVIKDTAYDVPTHVQLYEELKTEVAAFGQSTGSPHTSAIAESLTADGLFAIPLSWYSGWPHNPNTLLQGSNYCFEGMNVVSWMNEMAAPGWTLAVMSFPGEYGQDSAFGAKYAAEQLGIELVYDGEGVIIPGGDNSGVIAEMAATSPDWVYVTSNSGHLAEIMGGAIAAGLDAQWSGSLPSYNPSLLLGDLATAMDTSFYWPSFFAAWGADVPGMAELMATVTAAYPDASGILADFYVRGWVEALMMHQILEAAYGSGDMRQGGILAAAQSIAEFDFQGLAENQSFSGTPEENAVRSVAMYDIQLDAFSPSSLSEGAATGAVLERDFFVSDIAAAYDFSGGACFTG